ncbi:MAG TPA: hypothetical protein DCY20_00730, partial [Firmicutes bacterium]|nr:hypothetical protein [Bacillota bacterium]
IVFVKILKHPYPIALLPTNTIFVVPPSLLLIGHLNLAPQPNSLYLFVLYGLMLIMLVYVLTKFPKILAQPFHPGFAALTFPLAISTLSSFRMAEYLLDNGYVTLSVIVDQIFAVQLILATAVIIFVCFQFIKKLHLSLSLTLKKAMI